MNLHFFNLTQWRSAKLEPAKQVNTSQYEALHRIPVIFSPGLQIFPDAQLYSLSRVARHMDAARITSSVGVLTQLRAWYPRCAAEGQMDSRKMAE